MPFSPLMPPPGQMIGAPARPGFQSQVQLPPGGLTPPPGPGTPVVGTGALGPPPGAQPLVQAPPVSPQASAIRTLGSMPPSPSLQAGASQIPGIRRPMPRPGVPQRGTPGPRNVIPFRF